LRLERHLLDGKWVSPAQLMEAKEEAKARGRSLYCILTRKGFLSEEEVFMFFAGYSGIPFVRLSDYNISEELLALFPEPLYRDKLFVPLLKMENVLYAAMVNPLDSDLINTLTTRTGMEINVLFANPSALQKVLDKHFGSPDQFFDIRGLMSAPQAFSMMPPARESERVSVDIPAEIELEDKNVTLVSGAPLSVMISDISSSGRAAGMSAPVFLPAGARLCVKFSLKDISCKVKAQVSRCTSEKNGRYSLGVQFIAEEAVIKSLMGFGK